MKTIKLAAALLTFSLLGCDNPVDKSVKTNFDFVNMGTAVRLQYKVVVLDGNEYYATAVQGGWNLCPKLPARTEKIER